MVVGSREVVVMRRELWKKTEGSTPKKGKNLFINTYEGNSQKNEEGNT